jgi:hypothetical protein
LKENPEESVDAESFPKETLVIEQYQSDYPVVYDRIFLGNIRDPDGSWQDADGGHSERDYRQLNTMITRNIDNNIAKKWIKENGLSDKWQEFLVDYQASEGTEQVKDDLLGTFFKDMAEPDGKSRLPIEVAPDVKDARRHFDIISKVYPYLVIINTIEVAKKIDHKYIYILKNAPFYASIQSSDKARKLYKIIPELVATKRSVEKDVVISSPYDSNSEAVYEIPATDSSIAILRSEAERLSGKNRLYDFSLTPRQNAEKITNKEKKTWNATPEKIETLKEIIDTIKIELSGVDVPEFYDPVSAIRFLNTKIKGKVVPKKKFNKVFSPMIGELGKLSRASRIMYLVDNMFVKRSFLESNQKRRLRKILILNTMVCTTN